MKNIQSVLMGIIGCGVLALIASCGSSSSGGGSSTPAIAVRSASLTGAGENPPTASTATGSGAVVVNSTTMEITGGITFSGLTPTAGGHHIHQAPAGNPTGNGPVIIGLLLASDGVTAVVPPNTTLTAAQYNALLAGELYFNVHSTNNLCPPALDCSAGEIRGQINVQGGTVAAVSSLTGAREVPASTSTATGKGTVVVDQATGNILIAYITHDVANASAAHIHSALGPGTNGGVIVGFSNLQTNFDGVGTNLVYPPAGSQMSAPNVSNFLINYLYFNVHSTNNLCAPAADCTAGEIRGDITAIQ